MSVISLKISLENASFRGRNCDFEMLVPQRFSIPQSILYYVTKDPTSPSLYQKFIQSCKYFYAKNPILVVDEIRLVDSTVKIYQGDDTEDLPPYFILKPHQILCKLWVTLRAEVGNLTDAATEILLQKIFRVNKFWFYSVVIRLDSILHPKTIQSVKKVDFCNTIPEFADETPMPVENVFEFFPNLEDFTL